MKPLDCLGLYEDAGFYDEEFSNRDYDIQFFLRRARLCAGPVLEVACGTGRITLPIARAGLKITGLDVSRSMLEQARDKASAEHLSVTWLEQDCRQIATGNTFSLIFSAANAMQHLHDLDSVNAFLTGAKKSLKPDGTLILDVFNPNPIKLARVRESRYHHKTITSASEGELRVEAATQYHSATQILSFTLYYLRNGALRRIKEVNMRCFYPEELLALCRFNGLEVLHRYGNYDEQPFDDHSPQQILICRNQPAVEAPN